MKLFPPAAAAIALAISLPVFAQDYGRGDDPAMRAPPSDPGQGYGSGSRPAYNRAPGPRDLRAALRLRPDQDAAWQALNAQTAPDPQRDAEARSDSARLARMSTPQRLDFTQRQMQRDADEFSRRAVAIRGFYAQLSPDQKATFDRLTGPPTDDRGYPGPPPR